MSTVFGTATPQTEQDEFNVLQFIIQQWVMNNVNTAKIVRVVACSNSGGLSRAGTVDVLPLVNGMTAQRNPIPHGTLVKLPYLRMQGGDSAVILDPVVGDVGVAIFSDRDMSALKAALLGGNTAQQNPGSFRSYNWADGLYLGGFLNGTPTRYVQFDDSGNLNLTTPEGKVNANGTTIDADGNIVVKPGATITDGDGTVVETHKHNPGTYVAGSTPVTGKSDVPTS
jgi:hypothetical protein